MGEFSVTYEAMLGNRKVAVKEFYNRGCMYRQGNRVVLTNEEDQQEFEKAKQKFVEEARRLSKFASQPNVVRVYGYFEANNTVYIIMEFPKKRKSRGGRDVWHAASGNADTGQNSRVWNHSQRYQSG